MASEPLDGARLATVPPLAGVVVLLLVLLWWLWPLLQQLVASLGVTRTVARPYVEPEHAADESQKRTSEVGRIVTVDAKTESLDSAHFIDIDGKSDFNLLTEYARTFEDTASSIGETLYGEPQSPQYASGVAALHRTIDILDRIFKAWGSESELAKVTRLREGTDGFENAFGDHRVGNAARKLLDAAGFERQIDGFWVLHTESLRVRFQAMCVRLCLQKHVGLQKNRGRQAWTQTNNMDVVPKLASASLPELLWLYHSELKVETGYSPSWKEKATESTTCSKINAYRSEAGSSVPLALHDGLTSVARKIANIRRSSSRNNNGDRPGVLVVGFDSEAQALLGKLALPPGCAVGKLEYATTDLPHVFGMTGSNNDCGTDKTAEILSSEAVCTWGGKQASAIGWSSAVIFGIGASLDYTTNRGFCVVLLAGFEGLEPTGQLGVAEWKENMDMQERLVAAPKRKGLAFGAQVHDLASLQGPDTIRRRGPPGAPSGGG